jgi:sulfatase modifying factor 1
VSNKQSSKVYLIVFLLIASQAAYAERVKIPAGEFAMGCSVKDDQCENDEGKPGGVNINVPVFYLDSHEVTVKEYAACIDAGNCETPKDFNRNKYCNLNASDRSNHPINCVDWQDAADYCEWQGGRLPFEPEWEKAARAESSSRYPWGQQVTCNDAIVDDGVTFGSVPNEPDGCGEDRTWPVGSRNANAFGLFDMHGNAGEWTGSWYAKNAAEDYYTKGNLVGPESAKQRVVRGGSWDENRKNLRSSFRNVKPAVSGRSIYGSIGFRCAYDE